ncbi:MAG: threonine synthase [Deltaproteobacteria bacterium]|nr:threonine synthase [Deltaproteobacteria bacterium]
MGNVISLSCVLCGKLYEESPGLYACLACGDLATLRVSYDYESVTIGRESLASQPLSDQWRYLPLLPLRNRKVSIPLRIGGTPLYPAPRLRQALGLQHLWVKDDTSNPSGSLKDRASAVVILKGRELGYSEIATASTGNAGASLACLCASVGMRCHIFVPKSAPLPKLAQLLIFGANLLPVEGSYDDAFNLCTEACRELGWYNRNTGYNPYTVEGKKTVSMEISEQMGWEPPDTVIVPVGDGCILSGAWKGFFDLKGVGLISRLPRLVAAQAEGSQAIKQAFDGDGKIRPVQVNTLADSISVSLPRNGAMAVQDLRASGGMAVTVSDGEILEAMKLLGRSAGLFGEAAGVAALAALLKLRSRGDISSDERVVIIVTGSGLKDTGSALKSVTMPPPLPCSIEALRSRELH